MKVKQMELPPGWEWTTMGEIADVVGGGTPKTNEPSNYEGGTIPWLTPADLSGYTAKTIGHGARYITQKGLDTSSAKMMPAGTVLFTSRAPIGYVAIASNPVCANQGFKSFVLKDGVLPDYVYWWLKGSKNLAESMASGTTFLELSGAKAKQLPIPIAPLDQQKRIVAEIEKQFSRLDEAVANLKRVKANLKRYKAAVLKAAVEGRLVETEAELARREGRSYETGGRLLQRILETRRSQWQGKGKYKEPAAPDTTNLPELPEGWVWVSASALLREPLRNGHSAKATNNPNGLRAFTLSAVTVGNFSEENTKLTVAEPSKVEDLWAMPGDIYVERSNTPELVGTTCLYNGPVKFAFIPDLLIRIRVCELVLPRFVELALQSDFGRRYFKDRAQGISGTMPKIDQAAIETYAISLPPQAEQHRIVAEVDRRLSLLRETETQVDADLQRAERLRHSILEGAFSGRIVHIGDSAVSTVTGQLLVSV